jgi:hypothetical protein
MSIYRLSFYGPEDEKDVLLEGPVISTSIQTLLQAFMEPAAKRCLKKFQEHGMEIFPEDIFDEAVDMLKESGFRSAEEQRARIRGVEVTKDDFGEILGNSLETILAYNKKCQDNFAKEVYEQVERSMGQAGQESIFATS